MCKEKMAAESIFPAMGRLLIGNYCCVKNCRVKEIFELYESFFISARIISKNF